MKLKTLTSAELKRR